MKKIIFTNERLFMALVGPGGSGKTRHMFVMLASLNVFLSQAPKNLLFLLGISAFVQQSG